MKKFYLTQPFLMEILTQEESTLLINFFREKKYILEDGSLSIRYFMFYQNYFLYLPELLESKRAMIFEHLYNLGYEESDFMQSKSDFKKKPVGYKD